MEAIDNSPPVLKAQKQLGLRQFAAKLCVSTTLAIGLLAAGECVAYLCLTKPGPYKEYRAYVVSRVGHPLLKWVSIDADGLRRTYYSHCEANAYTIWIFGSSGLWAQFNRDWDTIPSLVAKHYEESGRRVCVKNYGEPGWVNTQEVIELLLELKRATRKPDVVIFYDGSTDAVLPYESDQVDVHLGFPRIKKEFESLETASGSSFEYLRSTNTYVALRSIAGGLKLISNSPVARSISAEQAASMAKQTVDNYLKNMEILDTLSSHYGFHYVCFWEPWLLPELKPLSAEEELIRKRGKWIGPDSAEVIRAAYALVRTVNRPHLVYLGDAFKNHPETLYKDIHLRTEGNRLVAERISQVLQHLGW